MTLPQPPYQPSPPQPEYNGYPQESYPQAPRSPYYPQPGYPQQFQPAGQPPSAAYAVPVQRGFPPAPPRPPKKPRFGLPSRIGMIIGAVIVIGVIASLTSGTSGSTARTPAATADSGQATSAPAARATVAPTVAPSAPAPPVAVGPAKAITARDWAKIAKSPDAHIGERVIVYGQVKQFDAATGTNGFRANVDGIKHPVSYGYADYETNTVLAGAGADLTDLVEGDLFKAEVVVSGSVSYETTLGGTMTAPQLGITKITSIGTAK